jgi:hypothetical protein
MSITHQYHISSRPRHLRSLFFVGENCTPVVNSVIACIAKLSKDVDKIKKPDSLNLLEKSGSVPYRLELSNFMDDFQLIKQLILT